MSGYLTLALAGVALVAVTVAGVQSTRLASSHADLATVQSQLVDARRERDQATRDRQLATAALSAERDAALQAEQEASDLKERIARDAGTARDGETAPVLKDAIQGLRGEHLRESDPMHGSHRRRLPVAFQDGPFLATRPDDLFLGRMPRPFRLTVVVDGRVTVSAVVRGFPACRDLAAQAAVDLARRPELVSSPRRVSIRCDVASRGNWA